MGIFHRIEGRADGVMVEEVESPGFLRFKILRYIKPFHLACDAGGIFLCRKTRDRTDARFAGKTTPPRLFGRQADRRDQSYSRYNNVPHARLPFNPCI